MYCVYEIWTSLIGYLDLSSPSISRNLLTRNPITRNLLTPKPFKHFNLKTQTIYMHTKAWLLALVVVSSWSVKTIHSLCMHHERHGAPVCEAAHEGRSMHLHDERYTPDDCSVCAFIFAIPEIVTVPTLVQPPVAWARPLPVAPATPFHAVYANDIRLRGPPVSPSPNDIPADGARFR